MKFQTTQTKLRGKWRYEAQFQDGKAMRRANEWLAFRPSGAVEHDGASLFTDDLQIIFELRIHFDSYLRVIRQYQGS